MIRKANLNDIDSIIKLLYQVHEVHSSKRPDIFRVGSKKYTEDELEDIIRNNKLIIFVHEDNSIIDGYVFCMINNYKNNSSLSDRIELYIDDLCVDKESRNNHIGKKLCDYVYDYAKENNIYHITLNVWQLNEGALKFYEKCGFKILKTYMEKVIK